MQCGRFGMPVGGPAPLAVAKGLTFAGMPGLPFCRSALLRLGLGVVAGAVTVIVA